MILTSVFFLVGLASSEADPIWDPKIEVRDLVGLITQTSTTQDQEIQRLTRAMELSKSLAHSYFSATDDEQISFESYLGALLRAEPQLGPELSIIGNAFATEASLLLKERDVQIREIRWIATGLGALAGLAVSGAAIQFKWIPIHAGITAAAGGLLGSTVGYFVLARAGEEIFLPTRLDWTSAEEFHARFPSGEDFLETLPNLDLRLALSPED